MKLEQFKLPLDQSWFMKRMETLGYPIDKKGMCYGISMMLAQAILCDDVATFMARLKLIQAIPLEEFATTIENLRQKKIIIHHYAKKNALEKMEFYLEKKILDESYLNEKEKKLLKSTMNSIEQLIIKKLSIEEQLMLEIPAFFDGLVMFQMTPNELLPEGTKLNHMDSLIEGLVRSTKLDELGGMALINNFKLIGCYTPIELQTYLECLETLLKETKFPVVISCSAANHAIIICYDTEKKLWIGGDPNQYPPKHMNNYEITEYMLDAFSNQQHTLMNTKFYVTKRDESAFQDIFKNWEKPNEWKKIHDITEEKSNVSDTITTLNYLQHAVLVGDYNLVKGLLDNKVKPDQVNKYGVTGLILASKCGFDDIVELLLKHNVDPNLASNKDITPLEDATNGNGSVSTVKILLNYGAKIRLKMLTASITNKRHDITELICQKLNPEDLNSTHKIYVSDVPKEFSTQLSEFMNFMNKGSETKVYINPLLIALMLEDEARVTLLVKNGVDLTKPCFKFADNTGITPEEVMTLFGKTKMLNLLEQLKLIKAVESNLNVLKKAPIEFLKNKQFMSECCKINKDSLQYADETLKKDAQDFSDEKEKYIEAIESEIGLLESEKSSLLHFFSPKNLTQEKITVLNELIIYLKNSIFNPKDNLEKEFFNQKSGTVSPNLTNAELLKSNGDLTWELICKKMTLEETESNVNKKKF